MKNLNTTINKNPVTLDTITQMIQEIVRKFQPEKVILFGSYANGEVSAESDVDVLFIIDSDKPSWEIAIEISLLVKHIFPMDILVRSPQEISNRIKKGDLFLKEILEKGKILYERAGERMD